ncbi:MAG: hypothetical protein KDD65_11095 [Bacteroidetes bacterium]|nr:hypothetical protein [Bacteroidota bacterium]
MESKNRGAGAAGDANIDHDDTGMNESKVWESRSLLADAAPGALNGKLTSVN